MDGRIDGWISGRTIANGRTQWMMYEVQHGEGMKLFVPKSSLSLSLSFSLSISISLL